MAQPDSTTATYAVLRFDPHRLDAVHVEAIVYRRDAGPMVRTYHEDRVDDRFASDDTPRFADKDEAVTWLLEHRGEWALLARPIAEQLYPGTYAEPA